MSNAIIDTDVPNILITVGKKHPCVAPRAEVGIPEGTEVALIGKPFWFNGEHWHRINVDGVDLMLPNIFLNY